MNAPVKQISEQARCDMLTLSLRPDIGSLTAMYRELSRNSGLSESWIAKFYQRAKDNPTQDTLDLLLAAIDRAASKKAA
jgi:hypothetical protein